MWSYAPYRPAETAAPIQICSCTPAQVPDYGGSQTAAGLALGEKGRNRPVFVPWAAGKDTSMILFHPIIEVLAPRGRLRKGTECACARPDRQCARFRQKPTSTLRHAVTGHARVSGWLRCSPSIKLPESPCDKAKANYQDYGPATNYGESRLIKAYRLIDAIAGATCLTVP
jgi:hypothetical protein